MAMVADDSGNEIKTVQDVLKSEGNDELKFGLLIGLIKLKQVSNKDVVDTLLHLVSVSPTDVVCIYILCIKSSHCRVIRGPEMCSYIDTEVLPDKI